MITCAKGDQWTIKVVTRPEPNPPRGGVLVFDIENVAGGDISGKVHEQTGAFIGTFTGTCLATDLPNFIVLTLDFAWGAVDIFMSGSAHARAGDVNRFTGGFRATARSVRVVEQNAVTLASIPPDTGDTGTGTGQQT